MLWPAWNGVNIFSEKRTFQHHQGQTIFHRKSKKNPAHRSTSFRYEAGNKVSNVSYAPLFQVRCKENYCAPFDLIRREKHSFRLSARFRGPNDVYVDPLDVKDYHQPGDNKVYGCFDATCCCCQSYKEIVEEENSAWNFYEAIDGNSCASQHYEAQFVKQFRFYNLDCFRKCNSNRSSLQSARRSNPVTCIVVPDEGKNTVNIEEMAQQWFDVLRRKKVGPKERSSAESWLSRFRLQNRHGRKGIFRFFPRSHTIEDVLRCGESNNNHPVPNSILDGAQNVDSKLICSYSFSEASTLRAVDEENSPLCPIRSCNDKERLNSERQFLSAVINNTNENSSLPFSKSSQISFKDCNSANIVFSTEDVRKKDTKFSVQAKEQKVVISKNEKQQIANDASSLVDFKRVTSVSGSSLKSPAVVASICNSLSESCKIPSVSANSHPDPLPCSIRPKTRSRNLNLEGVENSNDTGSCISSLESLNSTQSDSSWFSLDSLKSNRSLNDPYLIKCDEKCKSYRPYNMSRNKCIDKPSPILEDVARENEFSPFMLKEQERNHGTGDSGVDLSYTPHVLSDETLTDYSSPLCSNSNDGIPSFLLNAPKFQRGKSKCLSDSIECAVPKSHDRRDLFLNFNCKSKSRFSSDLPLKAQSWYHGAITRLEAERLLRAYRHGSFLVRNSESSTNGYSLSLK